MPMPPQPPPDRLLPGSYEPPLRPVEPGESAGVVSFRQAIAVVRRRMQLILAITAVGAALIVRAAAAPDRLAGIRADVGAWLHDRGIGAALREDLVLAVAEASANAVEHAYRDGRAGDITIEGSVDRDVVLRIVDQGTWRYGEGQPDRGRGMHIMRSLVDDMEVFRQREGTTIVLRKQLSEHE